ncbi:MAG: hypothetical protein AAFZ15_31785 [Bacteroidota bacterium]
MSIEGKILYYSRINCNDPFRKGIVQKYRGIINGLKRLDWQTDIVWYNEKGILINDNLCYAFDFSEQSNAVKNIIFNHLHYDRIISRKVDFTEYEVFIVRYPLSHPGFIWLLRKAKKINPKLKVIVEVPTYPYKKEHNNLPRKIQQLLDQFFIPFLKFYVDLILHYGTFDSLFQIPSIGIRNGVDVPFIKPSTSSPQKGTVRLLAVGNWNFWHGLERIILGMANFERLNYEGKNRVELTIVGGGREISFYKELVDKNKLNTKVTFVSPTEGDALDQIFDAADVGIGCLGMHRKNVVLDSSLKHRQYCARGLPFLLSTLDPDFPDTLPWVNYVEPSDEPIDIQRICNFFKGIDDKLILRKEIRKYAERNLDWSVKFKSVPVIGNNN